MAGRPTDFNEEIAARICAEIAAGAKISEVCAADDMPADRTIYRWLAKHDTFRQMYARACEDRTASMAEELLDIVDDGRNDFCEQTIGETKRWVENGEAIQRSRLRADTRKWLMSKMHPRKYGDKLALGGDADAPPIGLTLIERRIVDPDGGATD